MAQKCHLWVQVYLHSNISNCLLISTQWCNVSSHHCFTLRQIKISSVLTSRILETGCGRVCVCVGLLCVCVCPSCYTTQFTHDLKITAAEDMTPRRAQRAEASGAWESWDTSHFKTVFPFMIPCHSLVHLLLQI